MNKGDKLMFIWGEFKGQIVTVRALHLKDVSIIFDNGERGSWKYSMFASRAICYGCSEAKPIDQFNMASIKPNSCKGRCKVCHNAQSRFYYAMKRAKANPQNYLSCDDCDHLFHKASRTQCTRCKSSNLSPFV